MLRVYLRFSSSGLGLRRPASIASETYAGWSEACWEYHKMKTYASQSSKTLRRGVGVRLTLSSWTTSELVVSPIRFHKFPDGLHSGTMTKNTKTKTICKSHRKWESTASVLQIKTGENKKLAERTHHQLKHHQRWERYEKEGCQRRRIYKYDPFEEKHCCQFNNRALLLMSIVTHIITQLAGPKKPLTYLLSYAKQTLAKAIWNRYIAGVM